MKRKRQKRLYRSRDNRVLAGVCGGLADYFGGNPNTWRVIYLVVMALTSFVPGIIVYLMLVVLIPEEPGKGDENWMNLFNRFTSSNIHSSGRKELHDVEEHDIK